MASRVVEDTPDLPVIESVSVLSKSVETKSSDPFGKEAEQLQALDGQSPGFKRHVTAEIKKFQRGKDGTPSKQIHEKQEFLSGYDAYEVVEPQNNFETLAQLYEVSAPHHAAVDAKVANIVGLGYRFVNTPATRRKLEAMSKNEKKLRAAHNKLDEQREELEKKIEGWNEEDTFTETLRKVWTDYETMGNGYLEIGRNKDGSIGYLGHIPAQTMRVRRKRDGFVQMTGFKVQFFAHYGAGLDDNKKPQRIPNPIGGGAPNEVIHLKKYSPTSGYYGVPDIVAAADAIAGNKFASGFNLDYFENKAVPRYAIILKGATLGQNAESALLSFFETGLKGQNHRSVYIPLPADTAENKVELKLEAIETGVQDASFGNYRKANLNDILMVHRVPVTKISVGEGASLAVAKDADKTFKEQVCEPEQNNFERKVINKLISELSDALELKLNEMSLTDENTQSQIDERYLKQGVILPNEVRANKGLGGIEGGNERVDPNAKAKQDAMNAEVTRQRDSVRSANRTDSAPGGGARNPKGEGRTTP
jgi:PBSX family phage portal protein